MKKIKHDTKLLERSSQKNIFISQRVNTDLSPTANADTEHCDFCEYSRQKDKIICL